MRGRIAVENRQIEPQPATKSVGPSTTPLSGAEIIGSEEGQTGHSIVYRHNNQSYTFHWSTNQSAATATFELRNPDGLIVSNTYTSGVVPPEFAGHSLEVISSGTGRLHFSACGEPGMVYPFAVSHSLEDWQRLGFVLLGDDGEKSFDLNPSDTTGLIQITGKLSK